MTTQEFIAEAFLEDVGSGDYSTLASIPADAKGKAVLKIKEDGILAGMQVAQEIFHYLEEGAKFTLYKKDGDVVNNGETAFTVEASVHTILKAERLVLNCMQRMSGIATLTNRYVDKIKGTKTKILDTRKTTPLFREFEKEAVRIGGGYNLRMGLYDMIMLKDNHIDFCGGIEKAIKKTNEYLTINNLDLKIEVETRNLDDVRRVLETGNVYRIMLDNYSPELVEEAVEIIGGRYETEASGGITLDNILSYARTGVDYVSLGAITNRAVSMDLSLKAQLV
ncbi:carboxylating nicotinate-nucleotide diphosphorylase [Chryseobacterium paridis]|uniref:nicotinate-nucleotide diphosphorylase (carboxylating) n=1 Tax=Chryseobacterium paridis TaxID=2800328 RepID=A0ABS1FUQ3_9FLAO|nr:carboxylating nicotinate-nucleotide diphosphorylase [Chryseobacterium paridis]MBK1896153.1 carboxylating nicotinate-nucleotide diphosphorylase [Chryseobacterium paridis]